MNFKIKNLFFDAYSHDQTKDMIHSLNLTTLLIHLVIPVLIFGLFFSQLNGYILFFWLALQFSVIFIRMYIGNCLSESFEQGTFDRDFFRYYLGIILFSGALWGAFFAYAIFNVEPLYVFFLITILFALSAGSILTLGSVFIAVVLFNVSLILPPIVSLLFIASSGIYYVQIILIFAFLFVTLTNSFKKHILSRQSSSSITLLKQYENITNQSTIISKTDTKGIITFANDNFCKISGYKKEELIGQRHNIIRHPEMPRVAFEDMWKTIKSKKTWHGVVKNRAKNGDAYYVSTTITPILDIDGEIQEYIALRHDISSIMSDKKQLFDYLEANKLSVLIMIQIEDYDVLEKFYDKATVEEIEKSFGDVILHLLPNSCDFQRVYHLGNGLYALAKNRRTCQKSQEEIEEFLKEFLENVKDYTVKLDKIEYDISAICSYTYGVIQIYEDAKIGIEKAIENKQNLIYADGLSGIEYAAALQNIETLHILKVALDDKKVISFFQPIINNETKKVEKYESLVRLINEHGEVISPFAFLEVAKKGRYYTQVTKIVLENSFKTLKVTDKEISINLSPLDIENEDIRDLIFELLIKNKEDSKRIVFELVESEDVKDFDTIIRFIQQVKPYGVKIAIDDFGTGYSNFERLLQYEPDLLKIDGSLIKNIKDNRLSKDIVETIVLFAQKQKIKTVAEFVENEEIFNIVKGLGIDYSQGYAFGRPEDLLKEFIS